MDVSQYLEIFIDETSEHLQNLSDCIMELEKDPESEQFASVRSVTVYVAGSEAGMEAAELEENPRARSAKLRVAEKCDDFDL